MTKITAVAPGGDCPRWLAFLDRVTGGDADLQAYLQRLAGYALTGSTREHVLPFAHGSGGNGKGVFIGALAGRDGGLPQDGADRDLRRLDTATATRPSSPCSAAPGCHRSGDRGRPALGRGQDQDADRRRPDRRPVHARRLLRVRPAVHPADRRQPQARPALRRRGDPPPVPPDPVHRDHRRRRARRGSCPRSSRPSGPASCMGDRRLPRHGSEQGLRPPDVVRAATDAYLDGQDAFGAWLEECCDLDPNAWTPPDRALRQLAGLGRAGPRVRPAPLPVLRHPRSRGFAEKRKPASEPGDFKGLR